MAIDKDSFQYKEMEMYTKLLSLYKVCQASNSPQSSKLWEICHETNSISTEILENVDYKVCQ